MIRFLFILALHVVFTFSCNAQIPATIQPLMIGTYTYDQNTRLENLQSLALYLEQVLKQPVKAVSYPKVEDLLQAIRSQKVDIALLNTWGYLLLSSDSLVTAEPLVSLVSPPGQTLSYSACLLASTQSGIQTLDDLKRLSATTSILMAGKSSTSGNLIPRLYLQQQGLGVIEEIFKKVDYASSHAQVIQQVKAGLFDVGACGTEDLHQQLENRQVTFEDIKVLWTSQDIPLGPVVVSTSINLKLRNLLQQAFLQIHQQNPSAFQAVKAGWKEAKNASHYQLVGKHYYQKEVRLLFK